MTLHGFLTRLIWLCVTPLMLLSAYLVFDNLRSLQSAIHGRAESISKDFATALDASLRARIRALHMLAASPHADQPSQLDALYREALAFREQFGSDVILADAETQMLFNTRVPLGAPLPRLPVPQGTAAAPRALATGKPAVGDVFFGPIARKPLVAIVVPGLRNGKVAFLVLTTYEGSLFQDRLDQLALPPGWAITLRDSVGTIIARRAPPGFDAAAEVDASERFSAQLTAAPWRIEVEIPRSAYRESALEGAGYLVLFALGAMLLGPLGGVIASRRLGRAVASLADPAAQEGAQLEIDEVVRVRRLLAEAAKQRAQVEAARRESDRQFRAMIENASDLIFLSDAQGNIHYASPALEQVGGYAAPAVLGRNFMEFAHPDDLAAAARVLAEVVRNPQEPQRAELRWRHKNGNWVYLESVAKNQLGNAPLHAIVINARDVTERHLAETRMHESEERFRAVVEQSISGACIIDAAGRFVYVNPRLAAILGYESGGSLEGRAVLEVVAPESHAIIRENMRQRIAGEPQQKRYHFFALRKDGVRVTLGAHSNTGSYRGEPVLITTVQDVTELRRAEEEVERTIGKLQRALHSTIAVVSTIGELRDPYTHGHERRVGEIAGAIAAEMGLPEDRVEGVRVIGYLHDVGKIAVPAEILAKPTRLSAAEFDLIKQHAQQSYEILKGIEFPWPVAEAAWAHHERLDGSGYPRGLKGEQIILEARILAVADTVEAMSLHRPYRPGLGIDKALAEIERGRGTTYDPQVVDACLCLFREKKYVLPA